MDKKTFEVELGDLRHQIEIAETDEQLLEAKKLDDLAFGEHLGITMKELVDISKNGRVLLFRAAGGALIGESQILTKPILDHPNVSPDEAYNYGTAVHPDFQNKGIGQILFRAQEQVARELGKSRSALRKRLEYSWPF